MTPKFKVGDRVRVVYYGHIISSPNQPSPEAILFRKTATQLLYDVAPDLVGRIGTIEAVKILPYGENQRISVYTMKGLAKIEPYFEEQLELVPEIKKS